MSSSLRRILSSRANGRLSRGPKTAQGKLRSSRNAIRHGILAKCVVMSLESEEGFHEELQAYLARFLPEDIVETGLIEDMVTSLWRTRRLWAIETNMMNQAAAADRSPDPLDRLTAAFESLASRPAFLLLQRYESRLNMAYQRALLNLALLRATNPPNEPNPENGTPPAPAGRTRRDPAKDTPATATRSHPDPAQPDPPAIPAAAHQSHPDPAQPAPPATPTVHQTHPDPAQPAPPAIPAARQTHPDPAQPAPPAIPAAAQSHPDPAQPAPASHPDRPPNPSRSRSTGPASHPDRPPNPSRSRSTGPASHPRRPPNPSRSHPTGPRAPKHTPPKPPPEAVSIPSNRTPAPKHELSPPTPEAVKSPRNPPPAANHTSAPPPPESVTHPRTRTPTRLPPAERASPVSHTTHTLRVMD